MIKLLILSGVILITTTVLGNSEPKDKKNEVTNKPCNFHSIEDRSLCTCDINTTNESRDTIYSVGDFKQGGIIFWLDNSGKHGLVCSIKNQNIKNSVFKVNKDGDDTIFSGSKNTLNILSKQQKHSIVVAASNCTNYSITVNGILYDDWYLPSKEELNLMYINKTVIDSSAISYGGERFKDDFYWSSGEKEFHHWKQDFHDGYQYHGVKNDANCIRAIRSF